MLRRCLICWVVLLVCTAPAAAQTRRPAAPTPHDEPTFGLRVGVSGSPDQFYFGAHVETAPLLDHLTFRPNAEVGVGHDETLVALNFEFAYSIPLEHQPWRVYLGAGPALVITSPHNGNTTVGGGFNALIGIQHRKGLFAEFKVGGIDSAEVKFAVGYVFH